MRLDRVDLNLFVILDAVYRERVVTKVAQQLHLSQPAISNALGRLRQTFDDQLFVRTPDGMIPTPVADSVIGDVRKALALLSKSVNVNAHFDPSVSEKQFRLGMNDLAQYLLLPGLYRRVRQAGPKITISNYYQERQSATAELKSGSADLLLDVPQLNAREFEHQTMAELPYVAAMRRGHPLASLPMTLESYLSAKHVHVSSRKRGRGQPDIALHSINERRDITLRVQHYLVAASTTAQSDLVWTVPKPLADRMDLHTVALPFDVEDLKWNLYWSKSASDDPANRWMRGLITDVMADIVEKPATNLDLTSAESESRHF